MMITFEGKIEKWSCVFEECDAKCCRRDILLTLNDIERIEKEFEDFYYRNDVDGNYYIKTKGDRCIFLQDDLTCRINRIKPSICRLLPFKISKVSYGDEISIVLTPLVECPGYEQGVETDEEFFEEIEKSALRFLREYQQTHQRLRK